MEPPGTAPGSDPLIASAFMSIVPKDILYIGDDSAGCNPKMAWRSVHKNMVSSLASVSCMKIVCHIGIAPTGIGTLDNQADFCHIDGCPFSHV